MQEGVHIIIFLAITTFLILLLGGLMILVVYLYQQKRTLYQRTYSELKLKHEKKLIITQLEVQENMFRHISQEIHDNIGLTLSLIKLRLNTLNLEEKDKATSQINSSVELLSESITQLKDISKSLNADIINSYGLIMALENELTRIKDSSPISVSFKIEGEPVYMDSQKELIIFRIIQESFNNILKHSEAKNASLILKYSTGSLHIYIQDNGKGFLFTNPDGFSNKGKAGIKNMQARSRMIRAEMKISSNAEKGTLLQFIIPI
ncbi:MAG TPA: histidine kinase [Chitinophagaceae bacterium]|nr:histidine kinase [Chitinophagaceae bacterium]